jgi:hypothetical protein
MKKRSMKSENNNENHKNYKIRGLGTRFSELKKKTGFENTCKNLNVIQ